MSARPLINVKDLPKHRFDTHAPIWWGNLWLLAIETTMFAIAFAAYFYYQQNFEVWPPPLTSHPFNLDPLPALTPGTANMILLLLSVVPMALVDRASRRGSQSAVKLWLGVCLLIGLASIVLRYFEFGAMKFQWDSNAYGSITWTILVLHALHLLTTWMEALLLATWVFTKPLDLHRRVDLTTVAIYWYWVVGVWIPFYVILYFAPRMI
jgi:cytochrome c oxidase subunit 3